MENIIVFGTGKYFQCKKDTILQKYNIAGFLDNKVKVNAPETYADTGITVMNPMDLDMAGNTKIFLMSVHFVSMWRQLCKLGVAPERLVFPCWEKPYFEYEEVLNGFIEKLEFSKDYLLCVEKAGGIIKITDETGWKAVLREAFRRWYPFIQAVTKLQDEPLSRQFGTERGTPVDRFYIDKFLREHEGYIAGDVLEIEDNTYTIRFGKGRVRSSVVMDVNSKDSNITFNGNLETGEGIRDGIADCFILTQTLMYIFELKKAALNIGRLLKKGGTALITCSGISQNSIRCMDNYGCYFNFNEAAFLKMFESEPSLEVVETGSFGNVKTVVAHISGLCCEDLDDDDFRINDKYYPLIVYAVVKKR